MITLINEADESVALTLDGIVTISEVHDGQLTTRPVSDLSPQSDGVVVGPVRLSLEGTIPTNTVSPGTLTGEARIDDTRSRLTALRRAGARLTLYAVGSSGIPGMGVERFGIVRRPADDPDFTLDLLERITATSRVVRLLPPAGAPAASGPPRPDVAEELAETVEQGPTPTTPLRRKALTIQTGEYLLGVIGG